MFMMAIVILTNDIMLQNLQAFTVNLAHVIYVPVHKKTVEEIFEILILKFLAIFFKF